MATKRRLDPSQIGRLLEPGPLVLVTSMHRAQHNVMTAGWLGPLGVDPPRIGIAIHPSRLTHELISKSEVFALSIPTLDLLTAVHRCGIESGRDRDKFLATGLTPIDPIEIEVPLIGECVAHVECGLAHRLTLSDHDLFIGDVLAISAAEELFTNRWQIQEGSELLHHIGGDHYAGLSKAYQARLPDEDE